MLCCAVLWWVVVGCGVVWFAVLCCAVLWRDVLCYAMLCCAVLPVVGCGVLSRGEVFDS